jgi:hypothetical protein
MLYDAPGTLSSTTSLYASMSDYVPHWETAVAETVSGMTPSSGWAAFAAGGVLQHLHPLPAGDGPPGQSSHPVRHYSNVDKNFQHCMWICFGLVDIGCLENVA